MKNVSVPLIEIRRFELPIVGVVVVLKIIQLDVVQYDPNYISVDILDLLPGPRQYVA